jgi:hypothetical protein
MVKIKKKEIRITIENALKITLVKFGLSASSERFKKAIKNASKEIGEQVKSEMKKSKKATKKSKTRQRKKNIKTATV